MRKFKRKILFVLLFLFLFLLVVSLVFAGQNTLKAGENAGDVTLKSISSTKVVVDVKGVKDIIEKDETKLINGVKITVIEINYLGDVSLNSAILDIAGSATSSDMTTPTSVLLDLKCDGVCSGSNDCCEDCGCDKNYSCVNHECVKDECNSDTECRDQDFCTLDKCTGKPKKCVKTQITECVINDLCCGAGCTIENDPDCDPSRVGVTEIKDSAYVKKKENVKEGNIDENNENEKGNETEEMKTSSQGDVVKKDGFFKKLKDKIIGLFSWIWK